MTDQRSKRRLELPRRIENAQRGEIDDSFDANPPFDPPPTAAQQKNAPDRARPARARPKARAAT